MHNQAKPKSLASYLNWQIELSGKKQYEIAEDCGFEKSNIITMIKQGKTRLPRDKIFKMAKSLSIDPINLMKMMYLEYYPDEWDMMQHLLGQPVLTKDEQDVIKIVQGGNFDEPTMMIVKRKVEELVKEIAANK